jgi:predicted  nucleic acid-binding Zn-ribbon protein
MNGPALLALQAVDTALDSVANRRARLPEAIQLAAATAERDGHQRRLDAARKRSAAAQAVIDSSEHESEAITAKRTRLEQQLRVVTTTRQAEALEHEIAALNAERSDLDDRELAAMEEVAAADEETAELEAAAPARQAAVDGAQRALDAVIAALDEEQAGHLAERGVAAGALTADEIALYERLRARHDGVGIATLQGQRCTGCHLDLSRAEVETIRALSADSPADCPQCGRLLVLG